MVWQFLRILLSFTIPAFYKRIQAKNISIITKQKGPVIIAMNHPNAFIDPINITWVSYPTRLKYMARGDAFKPGLISFLLDQIGIVPIYRMRDAGKEGLQKNDESYQRVFKLLKRNAKIIVYAEGLCIQERRLRPLKKGVSRMVFGAYETIHNPDLVVIPVGINYTQPDKLQSDMFYNVGPAIKVSDFIHEYKENPNKANNQFLKLLDSEMRKLVTHINDHKNDKLVPELEKMVMKSWLQRIGKNNLLENQFEVTQLLTETINNANESSPEIIETLREKTGNYFKHLQKEGVRDWLLDPMNKKQTSPLFFALRVTLMILLFPFHIFGYISAYLPYKLTEKITRKIVKRNKEFYASMSLGIGTFCLLINFILWFFAIYLFSPSILWPISILTFMLLFSYFSLRFHFFILKTKGLRRYLKQSQKMEQLKRERAEIMAILDSLTNF